MDEAAVIDASPLIFLSRGGLQFLLSHVAKEILVPKAVEEEVGRKGPEDRTVQMLAEFPCLKRISQTEPQASVVKWRLGKGETAVLSLAMELRIPAILDDLYARRCATALGIPLRGTLGIILLSKQKGLIPSARAALEQLMEGGLYLSPDVVNAALARVGE